MYENKMFSRSVSQKKYNVKSTLNVLLLHPPTLHLWSLHKYKYTNSKVCVAVAEAHVICNQMPLDVTQRPNRCG